MNPIVKAKELVEMFWGLDMKFVQDGVFEADYEVAKRVALAAVDEIIKADVRNEIVIDWTYWQEVKLEIKNI